MKKESNKVTFENRRIILDKGKIASLSNYSSSVYGEKIKNYNGTYMREWNPRRSKMAAAILKGFRNTPFNEHSTVLYLGASTGTTVSHISDISNHGKIYAVEISYDSFIKLYSLAGKRNNIYPILEDANIPERYSFFVEDPDIIYQDIAQRNQIEIFNKNAEVFNTVRKAILIIKIRAISSSKSERYTLQTALRNIQGFKVKDVIDLKPYDIGNYFVYMER